MIKTFKKATIGGVEPGLLPSCLEETTRSSLRVFFYGNAERKGLFSEAEVTVSELACRLGIAPSNLIPLLNGSHYPNKKSVKKFADRLTIPVDQMMSRLVVHVIANLYLIGRDVPLFEAEESCELWSPSDVARYLHTYPQRVTAAIRSGELKAHRVGSLWKVPIAAVNEYRRKIK